MIRVYTASKMKHAAMWRDLCTATPHVQFHARWLKHSAIGTPDDSGQASEFWMQDVRDADAVLVYVEPGDHLRGALVEAGMAIAYGIPVCVIGKHQDYGTWQYHPMVTRVPDIQSALNWLEQRRPRYADLGFSKVRA
jgi:nucleoside 2-deoxyribosyltransferase